MIGMRLKSLVFGKQWSSSKPPALSKGGNDAHSSLLRSVGVMSSAKLTVFLPTRLPEVVPSGTYSAPS